MPKTVLTAVGTSNEVRGTSRSASATISRRTRGHSYLVPHASYLVPTHHSRLTHRKSLQQLLDRGDDSGSRLFQRKRQHTVRGELDLGVVLDELEKLVRVDLRVGRHLHDAACAIAHDRNDANRLGEAFELDEVQQVLDVLWQRAETVAHLVADVFQPLITLGRSDLLVEGHAQVLFTDVVPGDIDVDPQIHRGLDFFFDPLAAHLTDRLLEKLGVHLEADCSDLPGLFAAEEVAGPSDLQVARRDAESGTEVGELLNRGQTFAGVG